jgi:DNA-binding winged helix-turn-helix (wHTH) protein
MALDETRRHAGFLRFEGLEFDPVRRVLRRGRHELVLRPKLARLLHELLLRADSVMTRQELLRCVWPDARVSDETLAGAMRDLRAILRTVAEDPIRTVRGKGYELRGPVEGVDAAEPGCRVGASGC